MPSKSDSLKIAIIARHSFGDLLLTFPLINMLRNYYPMCRIVLISDYRIGSIGPYVPNIDEFFILPISFNKYFSYLKSIRYLRSLKIDIAIAAKAGCGNQNGVVTFLTGAPVRIA
jgi:ADP-heptose:LPS heptosyltransferase